MNEKTGSPHKRTRKEKIKDFITGTGLSHKQEKGRDFLKGGILLATGAAGKIGSSILKKARAKSNQANRNNRRP
jgi:FlaA1/EpsC-like NDP-sugar epimerase